MSSRPLSRQWRRNSCVAGSSWTTNGMSSPRSSLMRHFSRSTVSSQPGTAEAVSSISCMCFSGTRAGTMPFSRQFLWNMSANDTARMHLKP